MTRRSLLPLLAATFLGGFVALPVVAVLVTAFSDGPAAFMAALAAPAARDAFRLTVAIGALVAVVNAVAGTLLAWVLARSRCFGRGLLDALIDLPFAIPTLVTGLMLVILVGPQSDAGAWLEARGVRVLFTWVAIVIALLFVTLPIVVRAVLPVLEEIDLDQEDAAATLGAWPAFTFRRVILPAILPAVFQGALLTFARALGEFGAVVIVAGNIPHRTLTAPVHVFGAVESGDLVGASAMSVVLIALSMSLMLITDRYRRAWLAPRTEGR